MSVLTDRNRELVTIYKKMNPDWNDTLMSSSPSDFSLSRLKKSQLLLKKENSDFSAFVVIGRSTDDKFYVLETVAEHLTLNGQIEKIKELVAKWQINKTLIEDVAYQKALIQELRRRSSLKIRPIKPTRDKSSRLSMVSGRFETKKVYFLKTQMQIVRELLDFPDSTHDDLVDACVYSLFGFKSIKSGGGMVVLRL